MKQYTDIEQSRTLAEILLKETADQTWQRVAIAGANLGVPEEIQYRHNGDMPFQIYSGIGVPCWSLAALLDLLKQVKEIKYQRVTILVGRFAVNHWYVEILRVQDERAVVLEHSKELVDACVEIILKLHELKNK